MKYLFILGRNPQLSIAEILNYFQNENSIINFSVVDNGMLVKLKEKISKEIIKELGGILAIGEVLVSGNLQNIKKELDKKEIYLGIKKNINYVVWNFAEKSFYEEILDYLKYRFKNEKLKSTRKNLTGILKLQSGKLILIPNSLIDEEYFAFSNKGMNFFGKIIQRTDYEEIEERDMNKPVRREELAISPRLAKIMINLSRAKENQTLLDPFCGIGVILQEALLRKMKVIGIDKNQVAIENAKINLKWGKFQSDNYILINSDSSNANIPNANIIVTEPEFGEILKIPSSINKSKEILRDYEDLMIKVLNNIKKKISGRIVFTGPYIKMINGKREGCSINRILEKINLKLDKDFPISEFREKQIVGRQIFVLER